jgi:hypothetical protein
MSVEINFGAGPSVTKHSPVPAEVRGLGMKRAAPKLVQACVHTVAAQGEGLRVLR